MKDALGNEIIIGATYGYSQSSNGHVHIIKGTVEKFNESKVTLSNIQERSGIWGKIERPFSKETRKRSVYSVILFPVSDYSLGDKVTTDHYNHGETFKVVGIREKELELQGDWSGGTHNVSQTGWALTSECKKKI
jgi:hypothetical protein